MDIVNTDEMEWSGQVERHRTGALNFKTLFRGEEGDPNNFRLVLSRSMGDYASPRHRHNFDQIRVCIKGQASIAPGKDLMAGDIGYFPEGTFYGPQQDTPAERVTLVLQFGGASGLGYMSAAQLRAGQEALEAKGVFSGGRYRRHGEAGDRDSYEAIWEHVTGRSMVYPAPRYDAPVLIRPAAFAWTDLRDSPGVARKTLGGFTERGTRIDLYRVEPGAALDLGDAGALTLGFVLAGTGQVDGQDWRAGAGLRIAAGDRARLAAGAPSRILVLTLPVIAAEG